MKRIVAICMMVLLCCSCSPVNDAPAENGGEIAQEQGEQTLTQEQTDIPEEEPEFEFEYDTYLHDVEYVRSVVDPDFELQEYGPTGLSGAGVEISCISFNILSHDTNNEGYWPPADRAELVVEFLREQNADLVGLQEVTNAHEHNWVRSITEGLGDIYDMRMITEEEGDVPYTTMSIATGLMFLYRKDRFELLESGAFEYTDDSRALHWIKLKDKKAGRELYFTNTHLSIDDGSYVGGNESRCGEAIEMLAFWKNKVGDTALFATGDYNCRVDDYPQVSILQKSIYQPSCNVAFERVASSTLDFCYVNTKATDVESYDFLPRKYVDEQGQGEDMSDHNPVITVAVYK